MDSVHCIKKKHNFRALSEIILTHLKLPLFHKVRLYYLIPRLLVIKEIDIFVQSADCFLDPKSEKITTVVNHPSTSPRSNSEFVAMNQGEENPQPGSADLDLLMHFVHHAAVTEPFQSLAGQKRAQESFSSEFETPSKRPLSAGGVSWTLVDNQGFQINVVPRLPNDSSLAPIQAIRYSNHFFFSR